MIINLPVEVTSRSKVIYDLNDISTYGRYVLLFYQVPKGREFEKPFVFRRRLSLGTSSFESYLVRARLDMSSDELPVWPAVDSCPVYESDGSFIPDSVTEETCTLGSHSVSPRSRVAGSPSLSEYSNRSTTVRSLFWIIMVRFDQCVTGVERFRLALEGSPFCFVKRDLNYSGVEWLDVWQKWMRRVCVPGSENGFPICVQGESKEPVSNVQRESPKVTPKRSEFFPGGGKRVVKRVSPIMSESSADEMEARVVKIAKSDSAFSGGMRQQMLEHRVSQLEARVRSLEELLVNVSSR